MIVLLAILIGLGGSAAALAAPVDDSGYTDEQRAEAAKTAADKAADDLCELVIKAPALTVAELMPGPGPKSLCKTAVRPAFDNAEAIEGLTGQVVCARLATIPAIGSDLQSYCAGFIADRMAEIRQAYWDAYGAALAAFDAVAGAVGDVVAFIADPVSGALDRFLNDMKAKVVELFTDLMSSLTSATAFQPGQQWWRDAYAATGGIGLVLLALGLMLSAHQFHRGIIGPEEARRAFGYYPVVAVLMMVFGPPVAYVLTGVADAMSGGIVEWMGPEAVDSLVRGRVFAEMTSATVGLFWGFAIYLCLALALLGLMGTLMVQTVSTYMLGAVSAAAWGMSSNPKWRAKALSVPATAAALIFARPAALLALAIAVKLSDWLLANGMWSGSGPMLEQVTNSAMVIILLVMVAFSPWVLLKWMPLGMDAADSVRSSGPVGTEAALGAAGSTAVSMSMMRARSHASHSGGSAPTGPPRAGPPPGGPAPGGPAPGGPAAAGQVAGAGGKAAVSTGGKAAAGAGGKAAGAAAGVAGGAATGGALLAAQLAIAASQAAVRKAREAADAAAPDTGRAQFPDYSG
jgi:hypothetical protein